MTKRTTVISAASAALILAGVGFWTRACRESCEYRADHLKTTAPESLVMTTRAPFTVTSFAVDRQGKVRKDCIVTSSIEGDAMTETETGLHCNKPGKSRITFTLQSKPEVQDAVEITCKVVDSLVVPKELLLRLGEPARSLDVKAYSGRIEVFDAVIVHQSADPAVARIENSAIVPVSVGKTMVRTSMEDISADTRVLVGEKILEKAFALPDGASIAYLIPPGNHRIQIGVNSENGGKSGVSVTWEGASCPGLPESKLHPPFQCFVGSDAQLRLTNPKGFSGMLPWPPGPMVTGNVGVIRIP